MLLLLILVVGPLQAQSMFVCSMMDTVMYGDCCCIGHKVDQDCIDADCEGEVEASASPCCDRSVGISVDEEARQDIPVVKAVEVRSDVDPPPAIAPSITEIEPRHLATASRVDYLPYLVCHSGTDIYLITQRLRI